MNPLRALIPLIAIAATAAAQTPLPVDYALPVPARVVTVATDAQLQAALKTSRSGDAVVLAPGLYAAPLLPANAPQRATADTPIVIMAQDPGTVALAGLDNLGQRHMVWHGLTFTGKAELNFGAAFNTFSSCRFTRTRGVQLYVTNGGGGFMSSEGLNVLNCEFVGDWRPGLKADTGHYGIYLHPGQCPGNNIRIAGNHAYGLGRDWLSLGDTWDQLTPQFTSGFLVERNVVYWCGDDGIEMDGALLVDAVVRGNVVAYCGEAGISFAPTGPGPVIAEDNLIIDCRYRPFKFWTGVANGYTENVALRRNIIVNRGDWWGVFFDAPMIRARNILFTGNTVYSTGGYIGTATGMADIPGLVIDGNRVYAEGSTSQYTGEIAIHHGRMMRSWEEMRTVTGWDRNGRWDESLANIRCIRQFEGCPPGVGIWGVPVPDAGEPVPPVEPTIRKLRLTAPLTLTLPVGTEFEEVEK